MGPRQLKTAFVQLAVKQIWASFPKIVQSYEAHKIQSFDLLQKALWKAPLSDHASKFLKVLSYSYCSTWWPDHSRLSWILLDSWQVRFACLANRPYRRFLSLPESPRILQCCVNPLFHAIPRTDIARHCSTVEANSFQVGTSELIGPEFTIPDPQELAKDFGYRSRSLQLYKSRLQIEFKVLNNQDNLRMLFDARFCQDAKNLHAFHSSAGIWWQYWAWRWWTRWRTLGWLANIVSKLGPRCVGNV